MKFIKDWETSSTSKSQLDEKQTTLMVVKRKASIRSSRRLSLEMLSNWKRMKNDFAAKKNCDILFPFLTIFTLPSSFSHENGRHRSFFP
jgi:hypothetical protein